MLRCAIWATNALPYRLIEDPFFKAQFGPCIPLGFGRQELSHEMKSLAQKMDDIVFAQIGKGVGVLAVDGWTNTRHRCDPPQKNSAFFPDLSQENVQRGFLVEREGSFH